MFINAVDDCQQRCKMLRERFVKETKKEDQDPKWPSVRVMGALHAHGVCQIICKT